MIDAEFELSGDGTSTGRVVFADASVCVGTGFTIGGCCCNTVIPKWVFNNNILLILTGKDNIPKKQGSGQ